MRERMTDPASYHDLRFPELPAFRPSAPALETLGNGLRVYCMEDHEIPLVSVRVSIRTGSVWESADRVGLASVLAQSIRSGGSAATPGDALDDELGALAAMLQVSIGGTSGAAFATCLREKLPRVLELLAEVLRTPALPEDRIELARSALRTGIARRNDQIGQVAQRAFQIALFGETSPFAREPELETVGAITREDLRAFHEHSFGADRVAIGLVGDFDPAAARTLVERHFGDWRPALGGLPAVAMDPLPVSGRSVVFQEKSDVNQTNLIVGAPGVRRDDPDWAALRVGSFVFGAGGFSTRLMRKVRTEMGLAYSVGGGFSAEYERRGIFRAACQTKSSTTGLALDTLLREIERLRASPPTAAEVDLARDQIQNAEIFDWDSRAEILGRRMTLDYHGYPPDYLERLNERIRAVGPKDVAAAIERHLDPKHLRIVAVGKSADFDRPLADFGPVTVLDLK